MKNGILRTVIFVLVPAAGLLYLIFKGPELRTFLRLGVLEILLLLAVSFLGYLALAFSFRSLLRVFDLHLPFKEWFGLTVCNTMFNFYLPARGGIVFRAYYLKNRHGLEYSLYAALMAGSILLWLALISVLGLVGVLMAWVFAGRFIVSFAVAFLVLFFCVLVTGWAAQKLTRLRVRGRFAWLNRLLVGLGAGLALFSRRNKCALHYCLFSGLFLLVMAVRLFLCFQALGFSVRYWAVLLTMTIAGTSLLISLIPGNLGIKEGVIVFSCGLFAIPTGQALAAALVDRAVSLAVIFPLGVIYSRILMKNKESERVAISSSRRAEY